MSLNQKETERGVFHFSFLQEKNQPFLKLDTDLDVETWGSPIHEIISVNSDKVDGIGLDKASIPLLTNMVYNELVLTKDSRYQIKDSNVRIILYNLCKIGDMVLLIVWHIVAAQISDTKTLWEQRYSQEPGACCIKTYLSKPVSDSPSISTINPKNEKLRATSEQKCKFRNQHVECKVFQNAHFLNYKQLVKANPYLKQLDCNIPLDTTLVFGSALTQTKFCYDGVDPKSVLCHQQYDSIDFENRLRSPYEHNFQNFISDSLYTSFYNQNKITFSGLESQKQRDPSEHRLLFLTINFF